LSIMSHKSICALREYFNDQDDTVVVMIMELLSGGDLLDAVINSGAYSEADARNIFRQVLDGVAHMHMRGVVHRDLKVENLMMKHPSDLMSVKIIDVGLAHVVGSGNQIMDSDDGSVTVRGTPEYMAPEVIDSHFGTQADLWSCGVTMFELLCGYTPFRGETEAGVFAVVRRGNFNFAEKDWGRISQDAKDLIRALLRLNPRERLSAQDALDHTWTRLAPDLEQSTHLLSAVRHFRSRSAQRKRPVQEADALVNVRAVLGEVTQWANAMFGQTPFDDPCIMKDRRKNHNLRLQWV